MNFEVANMNASDASSTDFDSSLSDSSENECFEELDRPRGLKPYMFEPLALATQCCEKPATRPAAARPAVEVRNEDPTDWCKCGCCVDGSAEINRFCCLEDDHFHERIENGKISSAAYFTCITEHPSFDAVALNVDVLRVAFFQMRQSSEAKSKHTEDETMRYTAYRQIIRWCYGWLGKHNRKPLPSCCMNKIHERYPAGEKGYNGFKFVDIN